MPCLPYPGFPMLLYWQQYRHPRWKSQLAFLLYFRSIQFHLQSIAFSMQYPGNLKKMLAKIFFLLTYKEVYILSFTVAISSFELTRLRKIIQSRWLCALAKPL